MVLNYQGIRERMEAEGYRLSDDEFSQVVSFTNRKAKIVGKDETYLSFLLPDMIREWVIRQSVNYHSMEIMEVLRN